jgi:nicotinate-nucleotide adenylyltransferase
MVELALLDHTDLEVSTHELTLGRAAYTVETLEQFRAAGSDAELFLIVGGDSFLELETWRRWEEILDLAELVVLARPGFRAGLESPALAPRLRAAVDEGRVHFVENEPLAVSATEIRRRLRAGEPIPDGWLAPRVVPYLAKYRLYR